MLAALSGLASFGCSSRTLVVFHSPSDAAISDLASDADASLGPPLPDLNDGPDDIGAPADRAAYMIADGALADRVIVGVYADGGADGPDSATSGPHVLFYDGFDDGFAAKWSTSESSDGPVTDTTDGTNPIATFDSTQADYTRLRCNLDGSYFTDVNITASMKVRIDHAPTSTRTVRLDVRQASGTANIFYAVGVTVGTDGAISKVIVFKKVPDGSGDYTECELAAGATFSPTFSMGQWHSIKLTVSETTTTKLAAYFDNASVAAATYIDDCASSLTATNGATVKNGGCLDGQTGLGIQVEKGIKASVDDVLVTAP